MIMLNRNESAYDLPPSVKKQILDELLTAQWNRYPTTFAENLKSKIAQCHQLDKQQIMIGNGSSEVIQHLIAVFGKQRNRIVYPMPSFELFQLCGEIHQLEKVAWKNNQDMQYDYDNFPGQDGSIYILCNPNNPSGDLLNREFVCKQIAAQPNSLFIIDEAYIEFSQQTLMDLVADHPNVVVIRTLSKALGLAGIRFGYGVCHPETAKLMTQREIPYRMNHLTMLVCNYVFDNYASHVTKIVNKTIKHREALRAQLTQLFTGTRNRIFPSQGNFLLMFLEDKATYTSIENMGVQLSEVRHFPNYYRITIGKPKEHLSLLKALENALCQPVAKKRSVDRTANGTTNHVATL